MGGEEGCYGEQLWVHFFLVTAMCVELEKVRVLLREVWHRQSDGAHSQIFMVFLADYLADN